jgi:hypothetical protein
MICPMDSTELGGGILPSPSTATEEIVSAICWSCGAEVFKAVHRRRRGLGHVAWSCENCDVAWSGPGTPLRHSA